MVWAGASGSRLIGDTYTTKRGESERTSTRTAPTTSGTSAPGSNATGSHRLHSPTASATVCSQMVIAAVARASSTTTVTSLRSGAWSWR